MGTAGLEHQNVDSSTPENSPQQQHFSLTLDKRLEIYWVFFFKG